MQICHFPLYQLAAVFWAGRCQTVWQVPFHLCITLRIVARLEGDFKFGPIYQIYLAIHFFSGTSALLKKIVFIQLNKLENLSPRGTRNIRFQFLHLDPLWQCRAVKNQLLKCFFHVPVLNIILNQVLYCTQKYLESHSHFHKCSQHHLAVEHII